MARVLDNARYLHAGLADLGYEVNEPTPLPDGTSMITPIVPVLVGDDWRAVMLWRALWRRGRLRERGHLSGRPAWRRAPAHERHGHPRARAPGPRARGLRARAEGRARAAARARRRSGRPSRLGAGAPRAAARVPRARRRKRRLAGDRSRCARGQRSSSARALATSWSSVRVHARASPRIAGASRESQPGTPWWRRRPLLVPPGRAPASRGRRSGGTGPPRPCRPCGPRPRAARRPRNASSMSPWGATPPSSSASSRMAVRSASVELRIVICACHLVPPGSLRRMLVTVIST